MGTTQGYRPSVAARKRAPLWDDLPGNMQLLVVKEMTSWQPYNKVLDDRLHLTHEQKRRFEDLYNSTLRKYVQVFKAASISLTEQQTIREEQQHHSGVPGRAGSSSDGGSGSSSSSQPVVAMVKDRIMLQWASDILVMEKGDISQAQSFLRGIGFARRAADLGHWLGHRGHERFAIDHDTHIWCSRGPHAAPDAVVASQRPSRLPPVSTPTTSEPSEPSEQETRFAESHPVPLAVPPPRFQQRPRRGKPRRLQSTPNARRPPSSSSRAPVPARQQRDARATEGVAVADLSSSGNMAGAEDTGEPSTSSSAPSMPPSNEELERADRINREAAAFLARHRRGFARRVNRGRTGTSDGDYIE